MKKEMVLVIDDEPEICDLCKDVFNREGYITEIAEDGNTGLQKVMTAKPDVVLVDLKLPGMDGMELLTKIKEFDPSIVPIVITGYASISSAVEAVKLGAYDYLPKPFTLDQLLTTTKRGLERRQLVLESEALRREKEKMKELFVSMVSHQLRSPLTAILGYLNLILDNFVSDATEQKRMIRQASERLKGLLTLINDWLKMAQIDKSRLEEKFEYLNLSPILTEAVELLKSQAKDKGISLQLESPDKELVVRGDKETLQEIFINLIDNGMKYNNPGGIVKISTRKNNTHLIVEILDTGIGISEKDIPFIFDEFFRVKSDKTHQIPGTGLGLAIVKRMVESHSGCVKVKNSELGKGTTFTVYLPKTDKQGVLHKKGEG